jgi:transcriptional regulator with XRE-family HTH domain
LENYILSDIIWLMNFIRQIRLRADVTQQELARKAGTSQSTIAAYETGSKSPTLRTLERLANALDLELNLSADSKLTREDQRSLAYHRAVIDKLLGDPNSTIDRATFNLSKLKRIHPYAHELLERWEAWLRLPTDTLAGLLLARDEAACEMRQVSPFSGLLSPAERAEVLRQFREDRDG